MYLPAYLARWEAGIVLWDPCMGQAKGVTRLTQAPAQCRGTGVQDTHRIEPSLHRTSTHSILLLLQDG